MRQRRSQNLQPVRVLSYYLMAGKTLLAKRKFCPKCFADKQ